MNPTRWFLALASLFMVPMPLTVSAQNDPPASFESCDEPTAARLRFIEERLEDGRTYARVWGHGWQAFYALGTVVSSVQAATEDDTSKRADNIVSAVKALGGTIRQTFFLPTARFGADPMRAIPPTSPEACRQRLEEGEKLLKKNEVEARSRYDWTRHFFNFLVNIGGGLIVAEGFDDPERGLRSAVIGIAIGEAMTWTHPWRATTDLQEYERRFAPAPMPEEQKVRWELFPWLGGGGVRARF